MDFQKILAEAHAAATAAQFGMVEDMGAMNCGFAWVTVEGTSPLGRFCRKAVKAAGGEHLADRDLGSKNYPKGWIFWKPGRNSAQDIYIHQTGAEAFAAVLRANGIPCSTGSRYD